MSFLNRSVLQERAAAATVEKHPLLKECDVPPNVKQAYLQGCVLAVLERDDGKVTDAARQELLKLGKSLGLSDDDCAEATSIVAALKTPEDQGQFLDELFPQLSGKIYPRFFMRDFESLIAKDGQMSEDERQTVDFIGKSLTGRDDWNRVIIIPESDRTEIAESASCLGTCNLKTTGNCSHDTHLTRNASLSFADRLWDLAEMTLPCLGELPSDQWHDGLQVLAECCKLKVVEKTKVEICFKGEFGWRESETRVELNAFRNSAMMRIKDEIIRRFGYPVVTKNFSIVVDFPVSNENETNQQVGERAFSRGMQYYEGKGVLRDCYRAWRYFLRVEEGGVRDSSLVRQADLMIIKMMWNGDIVIRGKEKDRRSAFESLTSIADDGFAPAIELKRRILMDFPEYAKFNSEGMV